MLNPVVVQCITVKNWLQGAMDHVHQYLQYMYIYIYCSGLDCSGSLLAEGVSAVPAVLTDRRRARRRPPAEGDCE